MSDLALIGAGRSLTYEELMAEAEKVSAPLHGRSLVFLRARNAIEAVVGYVAFLSHGHVPVMLNDHLPNETFADLMGRYRPEYVWGPDDGFVEGRRTLEYGSYVLHRVGGDAGSESDLHPELALLLSTSGSTGSPKLVRLSRGNLASNTDSIIEYLGITSEDRAITTLPFSYSYGISIVNTHLKAKARIILTDKTFMDRDFWSLLRDEGATTFGGVPYSYAMLSRLRFGRMDVPSLRYLTQAGGRLGEDLHREFAELCAGKGMGFVVMYGQTEATARMAYLPARRSLEKVGMIGVAIPGGELSLEGEDGSVLNGAGVEGELVYRGANVSWGYALDRADLAKGDERGGVLRTGDLATRDEEGFYRIVGRKKRFLKLFGNRIGLDEVEALLARKGVSAACVGSDDAMKIYIESGEAPAVRDMIADALGIHPSAFRVEAMDALPRTEAGKIKYASLWDCHV